MPSSITPPKPPSKGNVFVIDDDPEITALISAILTREGYRVETANDPVESLNKELPFKPDLLLVDIMMPKMSGIDIVRSLRTAKGMAELRVMVVSALRDEEDIERGIESGADDYLVKPFKPTDLILRVKRQMEILGKGDKEAVRKRSYDGVRVGQRTSPPPPRQQSVAAEAIHVPPAPRSVSPAAKIVVIDDDPDIHEAVAACLKPKGHRMFQADSGEKGIELATREQPDLIVLDVMMPGMNGYEVSRELAESPYTAHIPILMLTARDGPEEAVRALTGFADEFLTKPFDPRELAARADALLRRTMSRVRTKKNQLWLIERYAERAERRGFRVYSPLLPKTPKFPGDWKGPQPDLIVQRGNKIVAYLVEDVSSLSDEKSVERWRLIEHGQADEVLLLGQSKETARLAKQIKKENGFQAKIKWTIPRIEQRYQNPIVLPRRYVVGAGLILLGLMIWMILTGNAPTIWGPDSIFNRSLERTYKEYRPRDVERQLKDLKEKQGELEKRISPGQGQPKF